MVLSEDQKLFGQERVLWILDNVFNGRATMKQLHDYVQGIDKKDSFADQIGMRLWKAKRWNEVDLKDNVWFRPQPMQVESLRR